MDQVKTRVEPELRHAADTAAEDQGISRAELLRRALKAYIDYQPGDPEPTDENTDPIQDWKTVRNVADTLDSMEDLGDELPEGVAWPVHSEDIDVDSIPNIGTYHTRLPVMRSMLEAFLNRNDALSEVPDAEVRRLLEADFGVCETTVGEDLNRMQEMGVAYPLPDSDPAWDVDELYRRLVRARMESASMTEGDVHDQYETAHDFFRIEDGRNFVPSGSGWVLSESEYLEEMVVRSDFIVNAREGIVERMGEEVFNALLGFYVEYLEEKGILDDECKFARDRILS